MLKKMGIVVRLAKGWVNHLTEDDLARAFSALDLKLAVIHVDPETRQVMYKLVENDCDKGQNSLKYAN